MKTLAVMCMALTRQRPSRIPLSRRHAVTCGVMLNNCRRCVASNQSSLRKDFMRAEPAGGAQGWQCRATIPPQGGDMFRPKSQGVALGYRIQPLRGIEREMATL